MLGMEIVLNGQAKILAGPLSVAALVAELGFTGKRIAVERNGEIVPKSAHAQVMISAGDRLEIVVAVGGG
jgi:sulfur carrier protein